MDITPIGTHFANYFCVTFAHTPELLEKVWRVRYDVYCKEFRFEREQDHPGGLERDEYDRYSLHCLMIHKATGASAGCVRLVKVPRRNPEIRLPLESFCGHSLTHEALHPGQFPHNTLCEISRLAVHTAFRRRRGEGISPLGSSAATLDAELSEVEHRTFPFIGIALIAASASLAVIAQRPNVFVMIESWLAILLKRLGLKFVQVGNTIDYHGPRAPYFITLGQVLQEMRGRFREIYDCVHTNLETCVRQTGIDFGD
jgi:N-acyl amino acid synthase of PEP-CTERM/exosortase system